MWRSPIFGNKPVQGLAEDALPTSEAAAGVSAGYHGYWVTDFLNVDPHLGTREDSGRLVDEAHARGMKGGCAPRSVAVPSYPVSVGPLDFVVCRSVRR